MKRDVFEAITHPTSRAIIALVGLKAISKHLRTLSERALVTPARAFIVMPGGLLEATYRFDWIEP